MQVFSFPKTMGSLVRLLMLAVVVCAVALVPMTKAAAASAGVENFTLNGSWSCTSNCTLRGTWGIQGQAAVCLETEVELEGALDVQPALPCSGAYFTGTVNSTCVLNTCVEQGSVDFYVPDASDPGTTVGPIRVGLVGTAQLASVSLGTTHEQGFVLAAAFESLNQSAGPAVATTAAGVLAGAGCGGYPFGCELPQTFDAALTGVEVNG
jgi:hypothetical protein